MQSLKVSFEFEVFLDFVNLLDVFVTSFTQILPRENSQPEEVQAKISKIGLERSI
jgi:hypothetical protein